MKNIINYSCFIIVSLSLVSCGKNQAPASASNNVTLHFNNTFKTQTIVLGNANSTTATINTSAEGQKHYFSELKYVISNIRLVHAEGTEFAYNIHNLDKGATVVNHSKSQTLDYVMRHIPAGKYKAIKFGLGIKSEINSLDQLKFPAFYAEAGANDTKMMWEWGTGYRFTKIEGFYADDHRALSIHSGSTVEGTKDEPETYVPGVDAYRDITLTLPNHAVVGHAATRINIRADFDKLLSGKTNTLILGAENATPSVHTAANMVQFVDNLGGNGTTDHCGMFTIEKVSTN